MNLPLTQLVLSQLAQTAPAAPARDQAMRQGMSMLMMLSLLGILLICMLMMWIATRNASRKRSKKALPPTDMSVDPWVEAGKRIDDSITEFDEET